MKKSSLNRILNCLVILGWIHDMPAQHLTAAEPAAPVRLPASVRQYLRNNCTGCHGSSKQKGDRRFDRISETIHSGSPDAVLLEEILDAINRGDMPPRTAEVSRPTDNQTRQMVRKLTGVLEELADRDAARTTVLRRLNRFEYVNTMSDLLGLSRDLFANTSDFPADALDQGFDNNGEALTLSDRQLTRYLDVALTSLESASFFGMERPQSRQWNFSGADFNGVEAYERAPVTWRLIRKDGSIQIGHGEPKERHANFVPAFVRGGGIPTDGWYTISVTSAANHRLDHGYEHEEFDRFGNERLKLALWIAPNAQLLGKSAADQRQLVSVWELPDGTPQRFRQRVWLKAGAIPFLSWTNGISSKGNIRRVAEKHHPDVIRPTKTLRDAAESGDRTARAELQRLERNANNRLLSEVYHGPCIRIQRMEISGPHFEQWPPASHSLLYGNETNPCNVDIDSVVQRFAGRAFRRPVTPAEVRHYADFIRSRRGSGEDCAVAIRHGLAAILTSPRFLYLDEGNAESNPVLDPYELASRLSYFLWSSMPDEVLLAAAENGELMTFKGMQHQVLRMLADRRSESFSEHFTDTWLGLNRLGTMPPDPKRFHSYYRDRLEPFFRMETRMFFSDLLQRNGSVDRFLESDYTFVNDALARHYGIAGIEGEEFRQVKLLPEHHRGGLLGQGSVLTLTANGIETSPVVRGIWILENILGTPPPPPPPDVEPLEPDTRGTTSIREQLKRHRSVETCADCHRRIDPAGFALEFFDPIGGYRTHYPANRGEGLRVDGSGELTSGEKFTDERGLKAILLQNRERFVETLTEKLMTYAVGRRMTFRDQESIARIAQKNSADGRGLRDLVLDITMSEIFQHR